MMASTASRRTLASSHSFSPLHAQDGSQHEFSWCKAQVLVPHSSFSRPASHQGNARPAPATPPSPASPLTRADAQLRPSPANPNPEQHQPLPSLPTRASQGESESFVAWFHHCFPTKASCSPSSCLFYHRKDPCPTAVLIWVFSLGGTTSALWGFASPVSASGVQTKCACLEAEDR